MGVAEVLAIVVPVVALVGVSALDWQRSRLVLTAIALVWGLVSPVVIAPLNETWADSRGFTSLVVLGAPIIEEIVKALVLPVVAVSRRCTWFVDGAVLGLAAGTGFAIRENLVYLDRTPVGGDVAVALARITSTNLMHAGCTAIVGAALLASAGRRIPSRVGVGVAALVVSIALHSVFNRLSIRTGTAVVITLLGIGVFAVAAAVVASGYPLSKRWAAEAMAARGESAGEQAVLGRSLDVADLLDQFESRFGATTTARVEDFIDVQRRIGIVSRTGTGSARSVELDELLAAADRLRRAIGLFPMAWLRSHLPPGPDAGLWTALAERAGSSTGSDVQPTGLWASLAERDEGSSPPRV